MSCPEYEFYGQVETKTLSSSPSRRMKIGDFLLRRLEEAAVRHLFGVPGDYNLELPQQLLAPAIAWRSRERQ